MERPRGLRLLSERTELTIISLVVGGLLIVVVASGPLGFRLSDGISTAAILAALVAILRVISKVYDLEAGTDELLQRARAGTQVRRFRTYPEFYRALEATMGAAIASMKLTHIRDDPPAAFRMDSAYFSNVEKWARDHPECPVRRVIAINNEAMYTWGQALGEIDRDVSNFSVRVTSRSAGLPVINMAIVDAREVFLAISGESPEQTAVVWISDEEVARYFETYYDNLWRESVPLARALKEYSSTSKSAI